MRCFLKVLILVLFGISFVPAQETSRQQMLAKLAESQTSLKELSDQYLAPGKSDIVEARKQGLEVFRILPREIFDYEENALSVRGGGAYYSFIKKSHSYNSIPQIELQKDNLSVGFYGANYGFITDLGKISLSEITRENESLNFLLNYQVPVEEKSARDEYYKIGKGLQIGDRTYRRTLPAIVGHTYLLRAISFDEADTIVAFNVLRKDSEGSLIIFWKLIENFQKPELKRD